MNRNLKQLALAALLTLSPATGFAAQKPGDFTVGNKTFLLNGQPFIVKAAEVHYPRIPRPYWEHRIQMCKALGMNAVCIYIFWNIHEQREGEFDFTGNNDVAEFCRLAQKNGLYVIVRPGPYVCAEWEMGGLPWWLLKKKDIRLRERDPYFMERVKIFEEKVGEFSDPEGRFQYFAQLHGWYEQLAQVKACFDLNSEENKERLGAYDLRTAAYRFCRILGAIPVYVLEDGTELTDGTNFEKQTRRPILLGAMRRGALSQWMSVFFHEDPNKNFEEPYSYERRLEEWVMNLGEVDQNQPFYKRLVTAKDETARKYKNVKKEYNKAKHKEHRWRTTFYGLCGLWIALLVIFGIDNREDVMARTSFTIMLPVGGVSAIIVGLRAFFRGYGIVLSALWGVLGVLSAMIPIIIMKYVFNMHPGMFVPAVIALTLVYMLICHLTDYHRDSKMENQFIGEVMEHDVKTGLMEPLIYTFKQKSFKFKGSKFAMLDDVTNQVRSISGESVLHYRVWTLMVVMLLIEMTPNKVIEQLQKDVE